MSIAPTTDPSTIPPIVSALTGAVTGALAGALASLWIGPTKAEREEKGKRRIDSRRAIAISIRVLDGSTRQYRQALFRREAPDPNDLETAAVRFAGDVRLNSGVLPWSERRTLIKRAKNIVGVGYWREGELRPSGNIERDATDSIALAAIRETRPSTSSFGMSPELPKVKPTDAKWDELLKQIVKLSRKYS